MVSAEDIKQRLENDDRDRVTARANAATLVGQRLAQLDDERQKIKQLEAQLASSINAATEVMNLGELAAFVDSSVSKLTAAGKTRDRARGPGKARTPVVAGESRHQPEA